MRTGCRTAIQRHTHLKVYHLIIFVSLIFFGGKYHDPVVSVLIDLID